MARRLHREGADGLENVFSFPGTASHAERDRHVLVLVAAAASLGPSLRACRTDPVEALRCE